MEIKMGDVFYRLVQCDSVLYRSECKVCEGKGELTVNGVTFCCPMCRTQSVTLSVSGYEVRRFKVYGIEETADNTYWKLGNVFKHLRLFTKKGRGQTQAYGFNTNSIEHRIPESTFVNCFNASKLNEHSSTETLFNTYFDDYKLALKTAEYYTNLSIERVKKFNEEHGTDYEMPVFNISHDKK